MTPNKLKSVSDVTLTCNYDPVQVSLINPPPQEITIYPPPLYIMSPRIRVYAAKDIRRFHGWISKVDIPQQMQESDEPVAVITITPTEPPK